MGPSGTDRSAISICLVAADDAASACDLLERRGYERINFADIAG